MQLPATKSGRSVIRTLLLIVIVAVGVLVPTGILQRRPEIHRVRKVRRPKWWERLARWRSAGGGDGEFRCPAAVAVGPRGNVHVADSGNSRIQKFDSSGRFLLKWGSGGTGNSEFRYPRGIAADSSGNVYVADAHNFRIRSSTPRESSS